MNIMNQIKEYIKKGFSEIDATKMAINDAQNFIDQMDNKACDYCNHPLNEVAPTLFCKNHPKPDNAQYVALLILANLLDRRGIKHAIEETGEEHFFSSFTDTLRGNFSPENMASDIIRKAIGLGSFSVEWNGCDDDIQEEIIQEIAGLISKNLKR